MSGYFHSVRLETEKCKGCTNCIRRCPTEAIRVREGRARIIVERCIDCGECIRVCPNQAKTAVSDGYDKLAAFQYRIALPAPALYGQFKGEYTVGQINGALLHLGFDDVFEVASAADLIAAAVKQYLAEVKRPRPLISQACPAVVSLIQVRFPLLLPHLIPIDSPMNAAARLAKERAVEKGYAGAGTGAFFITPCPAKITAVRQPQPHFTNYVDGVLSIQHVYGDLLQVLKSGRAPLPVTASAAGLNWGGAGGEAEALGQGVATLTVDGIHNVIGILEEVEMGHLKEIDYLECQACTGGCVGGALTVINQNLARMHLRKLAATDGVPVEEQVLAELLKRHNRFAVEGRIRPRQPFSLDEDVAKAISKLEQLEKTLASLPGLDCGSCGAPTCRALAEDIVRGLSSETDCVFKLREKVSKLAREVMELASLVPPSMGGTRDKNSGGER